MREDGGNVILSEAKNLDRCFVSLLRFAPDSTNHDKFYLRLQLGINWVVHPDITKPVPIRDRRDVPPERLY